MTTFELHQTDLLLSTTRAVRKRLDFDRPVDKDVLLDCLRLAVQAPTGSNAQGWRWIFVTDPDKKHAIAELYREAGGDYLRATTGVGSERAQTDRVLDSARFLAENLERVPVMLIPCILGRLDTHRSVQAASFWGSILPAVWSFQLALRSRGLGSTYTTLHLVFERRVGELLAIPKEVSQAGLLPIAYTKGTDFAPAARPPVEEITYWNEMKPAGSPP